MPTRPQRRLAAIVMADVVGYSALIQRDEIGTRTLFNKLTVNLFEPLCNKFVGRIIKTMGDAFLMEFTSVVNAVDYAVELQHQIKLHVADETSLDLQTLQFRVAVHLGDIVVESDDIHGEGVNIVARLQTFSEPGGVCISENVYGQVNRKTEARFRDGGKVQLKNIAGEHHIYLWSLTSKPSDAQGNSKPKSATEISSDLGQQASMAVLPFRNLSGDPEQTFFSEGITEDLITELGRFSELTVKARSASFQFKENSLPLTEIGQTLGASYVVDGSVRKAGNRVRVTVQLFDVANGVQVWAERYDKNLEDIFEVQDQIIRSVVAVLPARVQKSLEERIQHKSSEQLSAYEHFLQGRWLHVNSNGTDSRALVCLNKAVELHPQHAQSHAWMACIYAYNLFSLGVQYDNPEAKARVLIEKALRFGKSDPTVLALVAETFYYLGESTLARRHIDKALKLNPHNVEFKLMHGAVLSGAGFSEDALEIMNRALNMEPLVTDYSKEWVLECLYMLKRYEEALELLLSWQDPPPHTFAQIAACYAHLGDAEKSKAAADQFRSVCSNDASFERYAYNHARICQLEEDKNNWLSGYRKAGLLTAA